MALMRIVVRAEDRDVMTRGQLTTQVEGIDLGAGPMSRKKVVNRVKDSHFT